MAKGSSTCNHLRLRPSSTCSVHVRTEKDVCGCTSECGCGCECVAAEHTDPEPNVVWLTQPSTFRSGSDNECDAVPFGYVQGPTPPASSTKRHSHRVRTIDLMDDFLVCRPLRPPPAILGFSFIFPFCARVDTFQDCGCGCAGMCGCEDGRGVGGMNPPMNADAGGGTLSVTTPPLQLSSLYPIGMPDTAALLPR